MNREILNKVAEKCYLPANRMFQRLVEENDGRFRMALSISGMVIEQMERYRPDVLESFQQLVATGSVELLAETYYHSLAFVHSNKEFERQVELHLQKLEDVFHVRPRVFRNTELIYNNAIAAKAETMGFDGIIAEGVERNLNGRSPNFLDRAPTTARIKTLLRNTPLSDDLGFRFSDPNWPGHPLTAEKFADWIADCEGDVMQQESIAKVHRVEPEILAVNDPDLTDTSAKMQTSDHFYWMSTKGGPDGSVHRYFTPYPSPYDAYIYFMNVLADLQIRLRRAQE